MDNIDLSLAEVACLLDYPRDAVAGLVDRGILFAEGTGNSRRISIRSVARYVSVDADRTAVRGVQRVLQDPAAWHSVFGFPPRMSVASDFEHFPQSVVGSSLIRAVEIAAIRSA